MIVSVQGWIQPQRGIPWLFFIKFFIIQLEEKFLLCQTKGCLQPKRGNPIEIFKIEYLLNIQQRRKGWLCHPRGHIRPQRGSPWGGNGKSINSSFVVLRGVYGHQRRIPWDFSLLNIFWIFGKRRRGGCIFPRGR